MDETGIFLEMGFSTTIDFKRNKDIEINSYGRDQYRILLSYQWLVMEQNYHL